MASDCVCMTEDVVHIGCSARHRRLSAPRPNNHIRKHNPVENDLETIRNPLINVPGGLWLAFVCHYFSSFHVSSLAPPIFPPYPHRPLPPLLPPPALAPASSPLPPTPPLAPRTPPHLPHFHSSPPAPHTAIGPRTKTGIDVSPSGRMPSQRSLQVELWPLRN